MNKNENDKKEEMILYQMDLIMEGIWEDHIHNRDFKIGINILCDLLKNHGLCRECKKDEEE